MERLLKMQYGFKLNVENKNREWLETQVMANGIAAKDRLKIYENNICHSLIIALQDNFPVTLRLLGQEYFDSIAMDYSRENLPRTPLLMNYGENFPEYLSQLRALDDYPYMEDIAKLEQNWRKCYHAADRAILSKEAFWDEMLMEDAELSSRNIYIEFTPSFILMSSSYPIDKIWQINQDDNINSEDYNLTGGACYLTIFKDEEFKMTMFKLPKNLYVFLQNLANGGSLVQASEQLEKIEGEGFTLTEALVQLAELEITTEIKIISKD